MKKIITSAVTVLVISAQCMFGQSVAVGGGGGNSVSEETAVAASSTEEAIVVSEASMPTALAFLSSKAALRTFALESARNISLDLDSPGLLYGSGYGTGWSSALREQQILNQFNSITFVVEVVNVADYVHAKASIKNSDWEDLFTAEAWQVPTLGKGGYELPQMYFWFSMKDIIPFKVGRSITQACFRYLDENGRTIGQPIILNVINGKVYFKSDLAGQGILELRDKYGKAYEYDLRNGGVHLPVEFVAYSGSQSWVDGLYSFTDPSAINWQVGSWQGVGQNPAFEVTIISGKGWLPVKVYSNEGAFAIGLNMRAMGTTNWISYPIVNPSQGGQLPMMPGTWYIVPVWNPAEFREPEPSESGMVIPVGGKG